jgi:hypothetical protein
MKCRTALWRTQLRLIIVRRMILRLTIVIMLSPTLLLTRIILRMAMLMLTRIALDSSHYAFCLTRTLTL